MAQQRGLPDGYTPPSVSDTPPLLPDPDFEDPGVPERRPRKQRAWLPHLWIVLGGAAILGVVVLALNWPQAGTSPTASHTVLYESTADTTYGSGRTGMVTAQAPGGTTQRTGLLPITGTFTFHSGDFVYLSVQNGQGLGSVTCRITVDGVVISENTSTGGYVIATCQGRVP